MATITASSRTATTTTTTTLPRSTSAHDGGGCYDLKACLEILKRLAPKVSPDLPPPLLLSSNNNNVTQTTTTQQLKRKKSSDEEDRARGSDSSIKRSKTITRGRSSSPENDAARKQKKSTSNRNSSLSNSSTSRQLNGHSSSATISTTTTTAANNTHRRSTSTVSLQDLKARSNKAKLSNEATNSNTNNGYTSSSSTTTTTTTKTKYTQHASDLSISTNAAAGATAISPTLPSPAPTLSSTRSSNHANTNVHSSAASSMQHQQQQQPISAPSPEAIALGNGNIKWTRERFKRIAAICREKGRALKHAGDKRMREYSSPTTISSTSASSSRDRHITPILALFEQIDAVILYAYAFWCEDQAAGCVRGRQASNSSTTTSTLNMGTPNLLANSTNSDHSNTNNLGASTSSITSASGGGGAVVGSGVQHSTSTSSGPETMSSSNNSSTNYTWKAGCIAENWKSIFGLVNFVRGRAEKLMVSPPPALMRSATGSGNVRRMEGLPRAMEIVVAWMNMLEALILQHLTTNSSRQLNSQANRLLSSNITSTCSNSSTTGLSPAEGAGGPNSAGATNGGDNESIISNTSSSATSPQETNNFLQNFLKLQGDLEKIHTLWPASQNILLHPDQSALTSSYSTAHHANGDGHASGSGTGIGRLNARDEEDILSLVLRKGRMAYDYEPTKLDDIVMPNLPRDEDDQEEETNFDANDDSMDAEGEIDTDIPETNNKSNSNTQLTTTSKSSNISSNNSNNNNSNGNGGNAGPKSPEDLFKDEENYFRFSWPIIIHHRNAIAHTTSFGRALIFEMASRLGVDYTSPDILPSRRS